MSDDTSIRHVCKPSLLNPRDAIPVSTRAAGTRLNVSSALAVLGGGHAVRLLKEPVEMLNIFVANLPCNSLYAL